MDMQSELNSEEYSPAPEAVASASAESIAAEIGAANAPGLLSADGEAPPASPDVEPIRDLGSTPEQDESVEENHARARLELIPPNASRIGSAIFNIPPARTFPSAAIMGVAAGVALLVLIGGAAVYERERHTAALTARSAEDGRIVSTVNSLRERLDAIESGRAREETADFRRVIGEIKAGASATRDVSSALTQLSARVDRIEHDQSARLDRLGERIDKEATTRFADLAARLDKLEKRPAAPVVAAVAPLPPKQNPVPAKADPGLSNETTGAIEKPRPTLRGYTVVDVRDGFALIESRDGSQSVAPGDSIPGLGKVLRFERRGRDWVVVTSLGVIAGAPGFY